MNYLLVCHDHPPIIIHEEDRKGYYTALEAWDEQQKLSPLCEFLQEQTVKTWSKSVERWQKQCTESQQAEDEEYDEEEDEWER